MDLKKKFLEKCPEGVFLEDNVVQFEKYLQGQMWLESGESIQSLEKPGDGNMNFVLRVKTDRRTFIVKQARPFVEKYPQIEAPIERVNSEAAFTAHTATNDKLRGYSPALLHHDPKSFILLLEDLGKGSDYTFLYEKSHVLESHEVKILTEYLTFLHNTPTDTSKLGSNISMRRLNHEHIFRFPFDPQNGFDLDGIQQGLRELSSSYKTDDTLKKKIESLGELYLDIKEQHALLHGDFYPGSWLKVDSGIKIIDPEFGFIGRAEFDLGVFIAHLALSKHPGKVIVEIINNYQPPGTFDARLVAGFAGTEILRRLLGVAQLPLSLGLDKKSELMELGRMWINNGEITV